MTCIMIVSHTNRLDNFSQSPCTVPTRGGYSLYVGWYGCAAVLTPFFDIMGIELDLFWVLFLIHWHQNDLLGVLKLPILTEFDLFGPKFHFTLDLLGSNFQWPAAHPHRFSDRERPPPSLAAGWLVGWLNRFIYRANIARAPKLATLTG